MKDGKQTLAQRLVCIQTNKIERKKERALTQYLLMLACGSYVLNVNPRTHIEIVCA